MKKHNEKTTITVGQLRKLIPPACTVYISEATDEYIGGHNNLVWAQHNQELDNKYDDYEVVAIRGFSGSGDVALFVNIPRRSKEYRFRVKGDRRVFQCRLLPEELPIVQERKKYFLSSFEVLEDGAIQSLAIDVDARFIDDIWEA